MYVCMYLYMLIVCTYLKTVWVTQQIKINKKNHCLGHPLNVFIAGFCRFILVFDNIFLNKNAGNLEKVLKRDLDKKREKVYYT